MDFEKIIEERTAWIKQQFPNAEILKYLVQPPYKKGEGPNQYNVAIFPQSTMELNTVLCFKYKSTEGTIDEVTLTLVPDLREKGLARKLIETLEQIARDANCEKIITTKIVERNIEDRKDVNISFWKYFGYMPTTEPRIHAKILKKAQTP